MWEYFLLSEYRRQRYPLNRGIPTVLAIMPNSAIFHGPTNANRQYSTDGANHLNNLINNLSCEKSNLGGLKSGRGGPEHKGRIFKQAYLIAYCFTTVWISGVFFEFPNHQTLLH